MAEQGLIHLSTVYDDAARETDDLFPAAADAMRKKADEACDKRIAEERLKIILAAPDPGVGRSLVNQRKAMRRTLVLRCSDQRWFYIAFTPEPKYTRSRRRRSTASSTLCVMAG